MTILKYLITLESHFERNTEFHRNNSSLRSISYFSEFDAKDKNFINDWAKQKVSDNLNWPAGSIACGLSHIRLWETCVILNRPILILENDAKLIDDFEYKLDELMERLPPNWDLTMFGHNWDAPLFVDFFEEEFGTARIAMNQTLLQKNFDQTNFADKVPKLFKLRVSWGTHCYLISPTGAEKFLERIPKLDNRSFNVPRTGLTLTPNSLDGLMNEHYRDLNCFITLPHWSFVMNDHKLSTIWSIG